VNNKAERRLEALETEQARGLAFPSFEAALLRAYGTPEELADWKAAGRPAGTREDFEKVIRLVYGEGL
jgi:hypothetical protein